MKKRMLSLVLMLAMLVTLVPFTAAAAPEDETPIIKNIIYLIPDGGGYPLYDFANDVKQAGGFNDGAVSNYRTPVEAGELAMRPYLAGSARTYPYPSSGTVTDSAAAGTALSTGYKTINGYLGIDHNNKPKANILEAAQSVGKATGVIATYEWMHATPGAFGAHVTTRGDYLNIYQQMENKGMEVVLGSGYGAVAQYATIRNAVERGYTVIENNIQLKQVQPGDKLWGDMTNPSSPYDYQLSAGQATLAEMTTAAITALSDDEDGFFLMVEGSKVDSGGHANDAVVSTSEYLAFDEAFKVAVEYAKGRDDTLVIATPDHDTGGMYYNAGMTDEIASVQNGSDPDSIGWTTGNHTDQLVGVWIYAPEGVDVIEGLNNNVGDTPSTRTDYVIENTEIAPYLASLIGVDLDVLTEEMFVDVTAIGRYVSASGRFVFNNGDKYVYMNQSVYYKDGEEIDMNHMEAIRINDKIYVPAAIVEDEDWNHTNTGGDGMTGSGSQADPYIINDAYDFVEFAGNLISGEQYAGKYLKQTADIDLAGISDFVGLTSQQTFAGVYDGGGHTINLAITSDADACLFPYVTGTIMNLGTTGTVESTGSSQIAGIARSLRTGAKMINCYSTVTLTSTTARARGLACTNYSTMSNCYFAGTLNVSVALPIAEWQSGGSYENCYYTENCGATQDYPGITEISESDAKSLLAGYLNDARGTAATAAGVGRESIAYWEQEDGTGLPIFWIPIPTVSDVTVEPSEATVDKGDWLQLTASVTGTYDPPQTVVWSLEPTSTHAGTYIAEDGFLVIDPEETATSFTVLAKSSIDGGKAGRCVITVGEDVISEPDGSRARPYLIEDEADFLAFTNNVIGGQQYADKYFKQTADLDMAGYPGYDGMGSNATFAGIYNGDGYTINVNLASSSDGCPFPYTSGVIMNLGTTGTVNNGTYAAGICRSLRAGTTRGKLINCWSTATVQGGARSSGLVSSNYGDIYNSYFAGTLPIGGNWIAENQGTPIYSNCYYPGENYTPSSTITEITEEQLQENLHMWLNQNKETVAAATGFTAHDIKTWVAVEGEGPRLLKGNEVASAIPTGPVMAVTSLEDVAYAEGTITASLVFDEEAAADYVVYTAVYDEDNLVAVKKDIAYQGATSNDIEVSAALEEDATYLVKVLVWSEGLQAAALPATATIDTTVAE